MSDAVIALVWLGANGLLGLAAWQLSRRLYPQEARHQLCLHSLVLCWAGIAGTATLLGICGLLGGFALLAAVAAVSALTLYGLRTRAGSTDLSWQRRTDFQSVRSARTDWKSVLLVRWWVGPWCLLAIFGLGHVVSDGLLRFPSDHDSLMYHLPMVVQWLHAGSLYAPDCSHWSNPGNNELVGLWMVAPFSGDFLIGLTNLPATVLLALASLELGGKLGLARSSCHLAALAVVANCVVVRQLVDAENDVAVASLFLTCLCYGLRLLATEELRASSQRADLVLGSVSLGLLLGVKFYAVGYGLMLWGVLVGLVACTRGLRSGLWTALLGAVGATLWSGYWYARNALVTGSPFYPKGLSEGSDVLSQMYGSVWPSSFLGSGQVESLPLMVTAVWQVMGPYYLVAFLAVPLVATALLLGGLRGFGSRDKQALTRLALGLLVIAAGAVLLIIPFAVEDEPGSLNQLRNGYAPVRYGLCFLTLAVLSLTLVLQDVGLVMRRWLERAATPTPRWWWARASDPALVCVLHALLGAGLVIVLVGRCGHLESVRYYVQLLDSFLIGASLFLVGLCLYGCWVSWPWLRPALRVGVSGVLACGVGVSCAALAAHWHQGFTLHYDMLFGISIFTHLAEARGDTQRVCVLDYRSYPYVGSKRSIRVCQPVWVRSYPWLVHYLEKQEVTLVITCAKDEERATAWKRYGGIERLLREQPQVFVPFREGPTLSVFRIQRDTGEDRRVRAQGWRHGRESRGTVLAEESQPGSLRLLVLLHSLPGEAMS